MSSNPLLAARYLLDPDAFVREVLEPSIRAQWEPGFPPWEDFVAERRPKWYARFREILGEARQTKRGQEILHEAKKAESVGADGKKLLKRIVAGTVPAETGIVATMEALESLGWRVRESAAAELVDPEVFSKHAEWVSVSESYGGFAASPHARRVVRMPAAAKRNGMLSGYVQQAPNWLPRDIPVGAKLVAGPAVHPKTGDVYFRAWWGVPVLEVTPVGASDHVDVPLTQNTLSGLAVAWPGWQVLYAAGVREAARQALLKEGVTERSHTILPDVVGQFRRSPDGALTWVRHVGDKTEIIGIEQTKTQGRNDLGWVAYRQCGRTQDGGLGDKKWLTVPGDFLGAERAARMTMEKMSGVVEQQAPPRKARQEKEKPAPVEYVSRVRENPDRYTVMSHGSMLMAEGGLDAAVKIYRTMVAKADVPETKIPLWDGIMEMFTTVAGRRAVEREVRREEAKGGEKTNLPGRAVPTPSDDRYSRAIVEVDEHLRRELHRDLVNIARGQYARATDPSPNVEEHARASLRELAAAEPHRINASAIARDLSTLLLLTGEASVWGGKWTLEGLKARSKDETRAANAKYGASPETEAQDLASTEARFAVAPVLAGKKKAEKRDEPSRSAAVPPPSIPPQPKDTVFTPQEWAALYNLPDDRFFLAAGRVLTVEEKARITKADNSKRKADALAGKTLRRFYEKVLKAAGFAPDPSVSVPWEKGDAFGSAGRGYMLRLDENELHVVRTKPLPGGKHQDSERGLNEGLPHLSGAIAVAADEELWLENVARVNVKALVQPDDPGVWYVDERLAVVASHLGGDHVRVFRDGNLGRYEIVPLWHDPLFDKHNQVSPAGTYYYVPKAIQVTTGGQNLPDGLGRTHVMTYGNSGRLTYSPKTEKDIDSLKDSQTISLRVVGHLLGLLDARHAIRHLPPTEDSQHNRPLERAEAELAKRLEARAAVPSGWQSLPSTFDTRYQGLQYRWDKKWEGINKYPQSGRVFIKGLVQGSHPNGEPFLLHIPTTPVVFTGENAWGEILPEDMEASKSARGASRAWQGMQTAIWQAMEAAIREDTRSRKDAPVFPDGAPSGWHAGSVLVQIGKGKSGKAVSGRVEAWLRGPWAINQTVVLGDDEKSVVSKPEYGYALTHVPTGLRVTRAASPRMLVPAARWLDGLGFDWDSSKIPDLTTLPKQARSTMDHLVNIGTDMWVLRSITPAEE